MLCIVWTHYGAVMIQKLICCCIILYLLQLCLSVTGTCITYVSILNAHLYIINPKYIKNEKGIWFFFSNIRIFVLLPIKLLREQCFLKEHDYDFGQILFSLITMLLEFESQSLSYKNDTGLTIFCHVHKVRALFLLPRFNIAVKKTLSSWFVYSPIHLKHR